MPEPHRTGVVSVVSEAVSVETVADRIALGDLDIRQRFARTTLWLFVVTNLFVLAGLGIIFWQDGLQLTAGRIASGDRIVNAQVVMTMIGATTVQLGAVIYTMARAIFPATTPDGN